MLVYIYTLVTFLRNINAYTMYSDYYIICSAGGFKEECEMYREKAEESFTAVNILNFINCVLISFLNFSHLIYVVNISTLIRYMQTCVVKCCK